jgi:cytochrome c5
MSRLIAVAALLLCVSVGTASRPVAAQGAQDLASTLPDGPGRALVAAQCASCHSLDEAISKRTTTDRWRATVQDMIDLGAPITAPDAEAISSYLGEYFGLDAPVATQPSGQVALPDGPGRDVLTQKCFQCHQMSMWGDLQQDQTAWESVIYRMIRARRALYHRRD